MATSAHDPDGPAVRADEPRTRQATSVEEALATQHPEGRGDGAPGTGPAAGTSTPSATTEVDVRELEKEQAYSATDEGAAAEG